MPLSFPLIVRIKNPRLQRVYNFLMVATVVFVIGQFFLFGRHTVRIPLTGRVALRPVAMNLSGLRDYSEEQLSRAFCATPRDYDYWGDINGNIRYENHHCTKICDRATLGFDCINWLDAIIQESTSQLFFVSQMQHYVLGPDYRVHAFFVPFVEALSLAVEFQYNVPIVTWYGGQVGTKTYSSKDVTVVVLDGNQNHVKTISSGGQLEFSIPELLVLTGRRLDDVYPEAGPNFKKYAKYSQGPAARLSGVEMQMKLECFDTEMIPLDVDIDWEGFICYMQIESARNEWAFHIQATDRFEPTSGFRRAFHGIRVTASLGGSEGMIDVNEVFLNLCASAVLFRIPDSILFVLALWSLGHISGIYRKVVFRNFSIVTEAAGMAMRLMEHAENFEGIKEKNSSAITRARMRSYFVEIMSRRDSALDDKEIDSMISFCLGSLTVNRETGKDEKAKRGTRALMSFILEDFMHGHSKILGGDAETQLDEVDLDSFEMACSSAEQINFDDFVHLFDQDRSKTVLETFFQPPQLKKLLQQSTNDAHARLSNSNKPEKESIDAKTHVRVADCVDVHDVAPLSFVKDVTPLSLADEDCDGDVGQESKPVEQYEQQALETRFAQLEQHVERRLAEIEQRLDSWITPQLGHLGPSRLNGSDRELKQAMDKLNEPPKSRSSSKSTSKPLGSAVQESAMERLGELRANTIERFHCEQVRNKSDSSHTTMHSLLSRFEAHIDSMQSTFDAIGDLKKVQPNHEEAKEVAFRSDEHVGQDVRAERNVSERLARLEHDQVVVESELWRLREEVGAFDWKLEHRLEAIGAINANSALVSTSQP